MEFIQAISYSITATPSEPVTTESESTIVPILSSRPQTETRINDATSRTTKSEIPNRETQQRADPFDLLLTIAGSLENVTEMLIPAQENFLGESRIQWP